MSDHLPPKKQGVLSNPQILAAVIGGIVTITTAFVGVLPQLLNRSAQPTEVTIVTVSPPPTNIVLPTFSAAPTDIPAAAQPTVQPTVELIATSIPPTALASQPANVLLLYDSVSFTIVNQSSVSLSFSNISFTSTSAAFDGSSWGSSVPSGYCLRLRDATVGQRQPPSECNGNIYSFLEVGGGAIFWRGVDSFEVMQDRQRIAICSVAAERCEIYVG
jgi:hypothetical protein